MDYQRLNTAARAEGRNALQERLDRLMAQADAARDRNENGRISDGLSRGIRGTRYMLGKTTSAEKRLNGSRSESNKMEPEIRAGDTLRSPDFAPIQPEQSDSRIKKFGEGAEMLTPILRSSLRFVDENRCRKEAFQIYEGKPVRRDKHGKPVISANCTYLAVGTDSRFQKNHPHLFASENFFEVENNCSAAVEEEEARLLPIRGYSTRW